MKHGSTWFKVCVVVVLLTGFGFATKFMFFGKHPADMLIADGLVILGMLPVVIEGRRMKREARQKQ